MFVVPDEIICCCYQVVKNSSASAGDARDLGFISEFGKIPLGRKWQPAPVFLPGKLCGQRSLVGYSPWGHRVRHSWVTKHAQGCYQIFLTYTFFALLSEDFCRRAEPFFFFFNNNARKQDLQIKIVVKSALPLYSILGFKTSQHGPTVVLNTWLGT